jgi:hypothetical protein
MDLQNIKLSINPVTDNTCGLTPEINIEKLFIGNDGEKEYMQDLTLKQEIDYEKRYKNNRVLINALLATAAKEYIITKMRIEWQYLRGSNCSISTFDFFKPTLTWNAIIEIDTKDCSKHQNTIDLNPVLKITPDEKFIGMGNFNIELQYVLSNLNHHPNSDWDILYSIILIDHKGKEHILVLNRNWRNIPGIMI